jgi:hypothetical protein
VMFDIKTEEESHSICALLSVLYRFGFMPECRAFHNGDAVWSIPGHWSIRRQIPGKVGHGICAYILNYSRKENKYG